MYIKIRICESGIELTRIREARTFIRRLIGLIGIKTLAYGEGLLLLNCQAIHCFFMKLPIDAVYLDREYKIVGIETVKPWHLGHIFRGACHVLELKGGAASALSVGEHIEIIG